MTVPKSFLSTFALLMLVKLASPQLIHAQPLPQTPVAQNFSQYHSKLPTFVLHLPKDGFRFSVPFSFFQKTSPLFSHKTLKSSDIQAKASKEEQHFEKVSSFLKTLRIEGLRMDGMHSRLQIDGNAYGLNTPISKDPHLQWIGLAYHELIFRDEYNQEYRKSIFPNP